MISKTVQPLARYVGDVTHAADYAYAPPDPGMLHLLTSANGTEGDAPVFVEVGEAGIAVDHAMRRELAVQCS